MTMFDYWSWEEKIPLDQIKKINERISRLESDGEDQPAEDTTKTAGVKILNYCDLQDYINPYLNYILSVNEFNFGYNLYRVTYSKCNYNVYEKDGEYDWHVDESLNAFHDIKLTALINLSEDNYKGGDFQLMKGHVINVAFKKPGDMLVFKSHINHKVTPVTKGVRKTLTLFLKGPRFQ